MKEIEKDGTNLRVGRGEAKTRLRIKTRTRNRTFVDIRGVGLLSRLVALLLVAGRRCGFLASLLLLRGGFACWGLATSGGLFLSGLGRHFG